MLSCYKQCRRLERNEDEYTRCVSECINKVLSGNRKESLWDKISNYLYLWLYAEYKRRNWRL